MKRFKYILLNVFVSIGILSSVIIGYAAWNDTVTTGTSLTASLWNDMATAVGVLETNTNNNTTALSNHLGFQENRQIFTSGGTFTVPAGITKVFVKVQAGGGGGRSGVTNSQAGGGGGAGGYCDKVVTGLTPGSNITVTVGAGGNGGASPTTGGSSSFGAHCSATGGLPGVIWRGGHGGLGSNGDINLRGGAGGHPMPYGASGDSGGVGGNSVFFGNGAAGQASIASTAGQANSGAGGGGGQWLGTGLAGSAGGSGIVIVYW